MAKKSVAMVLATVMAVSMGVAGASTVQADAEYVIKLCYENNDGDPIDNGCDKWAELVKEKTDGAVEIQIYPSSQLGAKADLIEMMLMGQNVATIADGSYLMDYVPDFGVVMGPYLFDEWDQMYKLTGSDWWAEQSAKLEDEGLKIVSKNWIYGDRQLLTKDPIESLADLKDLKIRVPNNDISVKMFNLLGAASTPMALSEVYTSLSQGVVDGVENPLTTLWNNNFQEVCKHLTMTGHQMTFSNFIVGKDFFDTIPEEYQKAIMEAGDEAAEYNNELYKEETEELLGKFEEAGVTVHELSDLDDFKAAVQELYQQYEDEGTWTAGTYDTIQKIINE
ncbi:C4-dicarboxylate TRAP transporter substrate-binding protein [Blautia schinkii]|nr:C4-dicarboxylate TRAP transporter substrate-binding protein [Blautia schinkii]